MGWNRKKEGAEKKEMFDGVRLYTASSLILNMVLDGHPDESIASVLGIPVEEVVDVYRAGEAFEELRKKHGI